MNTRNRINIILAITVFVLGFIVLLPAHADEADQLTVTDEHPFSIAPFASYRVHEFGERNGKIGGGLAVGYALNKNISLELETLGESYRSHPAVDSLEEAGANFKGYLPIGEHLAPYGLLGYTRNLQIDENRMNAGAGIEFRYKQAFAFADGRWTHDFAVRSPATVGHALFRSGVGFRF